MVRKNIKLRVKNLVRKMGTASPLQIADMMRIPIVCAELPSGIRGYLTRPLRRKVIVLNDKLDEQEIPIVVAHELGHALMHGAAGTFHADTVNYCNARSEYVCTLSSLLLLRHRRTALTGRTQEPGRDDIQRSAFIAMQVYRKVVVI